MKRKLLTILLTLITALCLTLGLAACDRNGASSESDDIWTIERVYAHAQALGFEGSLEDLIAQFKGEAGKDGLDGKDGVGVKKIYINENSELIIELTEGEPINLGSIRGKDGVNGADGKDGKDGTDGKDGMNGTDGKDGVTPHIGENGNWFIGERDTGIKAEGKDGKDGKDGVNGTDGKDGQDGQDGKDGVTPHIGENGNWFIGERDTGIKAEGKDGQDGKDGVNGTDGKDGQDGQDGKDGVNGADGKDGANGTDGKDGVTPHIGENGNWFIGERDTGIKAEGKDGQDLTKCEHIFPPEWTVQVAASCTSIGYSTRTCETCGFVEYQFQKATGHVWGEAEDLIATCTSHWTVRICTVCEASVVEAAEPRGHKFLDNVCVYCGKTDWENVDLSYLDMYCGTYGYNYFADLEKGTSLQKLYREIDREVRIFHVDDTRSPANQLVASFNYRDLNLTQDEAISVWKTYKDDNPLFYWLSNTVTCSNTELNLLVDEAYANGAVRSYYNRLVISKVEEFISQLDANDGAYRKALGFHDAILYAVDYAYQEDGTPEDEAWAHNVIGVFTEQGAVCEGYARTFQLLLNVAGVESVYVSGDGGGEAHAWNLAKMDDGKWYWFDLTWDDASVNGQASWKWGIRYNYFCVTDTTDVNKTEGGWETSYATFLERHTPDSQNGKAEKFLYELPVRAKKEFASGEFPILNEEFQTGEFKTDAFTASVVGYNALEIHAIPIGDDIMIPDRLEYGEHIYDVISLGCGKDGVSYSINLNGVKSITIPKTVKFIWDFACNNFENIYVVPENLWFTSKDGVLFTKSLYTLIQYPTLNPRTEYMIPEETKELAHGSFSSFEICSSLKSLTIGPNVSIIGITNWGGGYHDSDDHFGGNIVLGEFDRIYGGMAENPQILIDVNNKKFCSDNVAIYDYEKTIILCLLDRNITSYEISATLMRIEDIADGFTVFDSCEHLERFTIQEGNTYFQIKDGVLYDYDFNTIIEVPHALKGEISIADGLTNIAKDAFWGCSRLTSITIPESVTSIGEYAFLGCSELTSVTIEGDLTSIGRGAFSGCSGLKNIEIPNSVTSIEAEMFSSCNSLENIIIPDNVTSIGEAAFSNCGSLTSIKIPDNVTSIGEAAFSNCGSLTSIKIPDNVTSIGAAAFSNCGSLTRVTIGNSVTAIGSSAFMWCSGLKNIEIPDSVTSIGEYAFV